MIHKEGSFAILIHFKGPKICEKRARQKECCSRALGMIFRGSCTRDPEGSETDVGALMSGRPYSLLQELVRTI